MGFFKNRLVEGVTSELKGLLPELEREGEAYLRSLGPEGGIVVLQPIRFVQVYDRIANLRLRLFDLIYGEDPGAEHPPLETPERVSGADVRTPLFWGS